MAVISVQIKAWASLTKHFKLVVIIDLGMVIVKAWLVEFPIAMASYSYSYTLDLLPTSMASIAEPLFRL